ncbi:MAG: HAD family hydrolase, partial [Planctomycetota bacterium]
MKRPAVFLDRDNTIIVNDGDLGDPDAVRLIQGAASAISSLCGLGYKVVVVTNQGGVARGKYTEEDVDAVHDRIEAMIHERANGARIDAFYFCPFHPQGTVDRYKKEHPTRKPKPGMLLQAAEDLGLDLAQSWMVGDALRDTDAGAAAGCRTVLLQPDWTDTSLADLRKADRAKSPASRKKKAEPDFIAKGLVEAVRIIASQRKPEASDEISRTRIAGKRWDAQAMAKLQEPRPPQPAPPGNTP